MSASGFSYGAGLAPAVVFAALVGGIALFLWWRRGSPPFMLALAAGLGSFAGAFALLNLLVQVDDLSSAWLEQEARNGRLALRTASVIVAAVGATGVYQLIRRGPDPFLLSRLEAHVTWHQREGRRLLRAFAHQSFFYTSVMGLLWVLAAEARTSTAIVALNWLVTFVIDDWAILRHYSRHYYIAPSPRHQLQLQAINLMIALLLVAVLAQEYSAWAASIGAIVVLWLFVAIPVARAVSTLYGRLRDVTGGGRPQAPLGASYGEVWKRNRLLEDALHKYHGRAIAWRDSHEAAVRQRDAAQRAEWIGRRHAVTINDRRRADRAGAYGMTGQDLADAIAAGDEERALAALRADPTLAVARDHEGTGLVCVAATNGARAVVDALLAEAPPVDVFDVIALDDAHRLRAMLDDDPMLWTVRSPAVGHPLGFAARLGHVAAVDALLAHGADPDGQLDYYPPQLRASASAQLAGMVVGFMGLRVTDEVPLTVAIFGGNLGTVRALIDGGADPNVDWGLTSPLHHAARIGDRDLAEILITGGADPARRDGEGCDPAQTAEAAGHSELARLIRAHQDDAADRLREAAAKRWRVRRERYPVP